MESLFGVVCLSMLQGQQGRAYKMLVAYLGAGRNCVWRGASGALQKLEDTCTSAEILHGALELRSDAHAA